MMETNSEENSAELRRIDELLAADIRERRAYGYQSQRSLSFDSEGRQRPFAMVENQGQSSRVPFDFVADEPRVQPPVMQATKRMSTRSVYRNLEESIHRSKDIDSMHQETAILTDSDEKPVDDWKIGDPIHDDTLYLGMIRNKVGAFVNNIWIQIFIAAVIITNALILGVLTFLYDNPRMTNKIETVERGFLIIFSVELGCQLFYLGGDFYKHGWIVFDTLLVFFSWIFLDSSVSILRSFRVFRVFALASRWGALRRLVRAVARTLPNMATIAVMMILFFYTFTVLYTNLYHDLYDQGYLDYDYFGRMDRTFLTLFQVMTLDSWTAMVRQVMEAHEFAWIGFCIWAILTSFILVSLIVAVITESLIELTSAKEESSRKKMYRNQQEMIQAQTEDLLAESKEIIKIQRTMLKNQIIMQESLKSIMLQLQGTTPMSPESTGTRNSEVGSRIEAGLRQSINSSSDTLKPVQQILGEELSETLEESESNRDVQE